MRRTTAELLLFGTTAIWGSTFFVIKLMVSAGAAFSPLALVAARFLIAFVVSLIAFGIPKISPGIVKGGVFVGAANFLGFYLQTVGLVYTTPAKSGFITSLFILFIPFVSKIWERAKIPINIYIALVPAVLGLWILSGVGKSILSVNPGDAITLLSAVVFAFQIVGVQVFTSKFRWQDIMTTSFITTAALGILAGIFSGEFAANLTPSGIAGIVYLGVVATVGALGLQMYAQRFTTSARASVIYILEPIFAALFAWIFISQGMKPNEIAGAALIFVATIIGIADFDRGAK
ncbi:DMT family transporter [bacterium]|nr:DMT family transporter [bacterium]